MWLFYAMASALFAGITSILAKIGIKNTDSNLATALRTIVIVIFAWLMVLVVGSVGTISQISLFSFIFLILSGLATGGSWLCYFLALKMGDINKVVPIDKSSTVLTVLLAFLFLGEEISFIKLLCVLAIGAGTLLMIEKKEIMKNDESPESNKWFIYAVLSAVFASLTAILGKIGIQNVESNLGTAIRTIAVAVVAWLIVLIQGKHKEIHTIDKRSWIFILLSGLATGISWLCYYRALQEGPASVVVPIDKLSILVTIGFGAVVFHEKLLKKAVAGLVLIVAGTVVMATV